MDVVWVIVDARKAGGVDCVRVVAVDAFNQMPRLKHDTFARKTAIALLKITISYKRPQNTDYKQQ